MILSDVLRKKGCMTIDECKLKLEREFRYQHRNSFSG